MLDDSRYMVYMVIYGNSLVLVYMALYGNVK